MAIFVKVGGAWKSATGCGRAKIEGAWKTITQVFHKTEGTWRPVCSSGLGMIFFSTAELEGQKLCNGEQSFLDLMGYYLKAATTGPSAPTGLNTHSHAFQNFTLDNCGEPIRCNRSSWGSSNSVMRDHNHTANHGHSAVNHEPLNQEMFAYEDSGGLPAGGILFVDGAIPAGFTEYVNNGRYIKGGIGGVAGGAAQHTHNYTGFSSYDDTYTTWSDVVAGDQNVAQRANHRHVIDHSHTENNDPPYYKLRAIRANADMSMEDIPSGVIAFFVTADPPDGWSVFNPAVGRFIQINSAHGGTGGAATHTHNHTGDVDDYTAVRLSDDVATYVVHYIHDHAWPANDHSTETLEPLHKEVLLCKKD